MGVCGGPGGAGQGARWTIGLRLDGGEGRIWVMGDNEEGDGRDQGMDLVAPALSGAVPATGFLRQSSINLDSRGFIPVNKVGLGGVGRVRGWGWQQVPPRPRPTHRALGPLPTDDADQRPRRVCSWRCCHFPPGLEEQSESEHPTLADGSCPGYDQPGGRTGKGEMGGSPKVSASPCPPLQLLALGPGSDFQGSVVACLTSLLQVMEPADRASPGAHPETSFLCPQDTPSN